jgi:hypothetical protein
MKYAFTSISIFGFIFTFFITIGDGSPIGLGIASCGFAIATALMGKK